MSRDKAKAENQLKQSKSEIERELTVKGQEGHLAEDEQPCYRVEEAPLVSFSSAKPHTSLTSKLQQSPDPKTLEAKATRRHKNTNAKLKGTASGGAKNSSPARSHFGSKQNASRQVAKSPKHKSAAGVQPSSRLANTVQPGESPQLGVIDEVSSVSQPQLAMLGTQLPSNRPLAGVDYGLGFQSPETSFLVGQPAEVLERRPHKAADVRGYNPGTERTGMHMRTEPRLPG